MADQYPFPTSRPARSPSGYHASPRTAERGPIYREVQVTAHSPGAMHTSAAGEDDAPDAFWGHYVEDRLRHFSQESR